MASFVSSSILLLFLFFPIVMPLPLSTNSRWIMGEGGRRVKLACVNWSSHSELMLAEGLSKQPMDTIAKQIVSMGFNCIRYTWPVYLLTNDSLASLTVRQSFQQFGFIDVQANNPSIIDVPLIKAYQVDRFSIGSNLGKHNLMVILDNHISKPGWCCSNLDDNGFFGDKYFNPDQWITGLTRMATLFNGVTNVVGMSLRNELRGPRQNVNDWYKYMQNGAEAVHSANPDVLVILSGFDFDRDLSFIKTQPVKLTFSGKLVFEAHWYGFSDGPQTWVTGNPNEEPMSMAIANRYLNCFLGVAAELDLDWALWTLTGSYYVREGVVGLNEYYGPWIIIGVHPGIRASYKEFQLSKLLSGVSQRPGLSEVKPHKVIFHPLTGLCITRKSFDHRLRLGPCTNSYAWSYSPHKTLLVNGTHYCLQANGSRTSGKIGIFCTGSNSKWEMISDSKMHLSTKLGDGKSICLDVAPDKTIITNSCKCISKDNTCDPSSQWFKLVDSTRSSKRVKRSLLQ
ncbi:Cytochrome P450 86A2 [Hibiscus syriacus]|uniref:Cytochrome P450 86A2 n=1 Tax=Hibiscus syriacus TaxID=106335 RepID=A0A6A3A785_HIBSY|nr:Cytochrome P450 86A2 [Hibiscus syriacus]